MIVIDEILQGHPLRKYLGEDSDVFYPSEMVIIAKNQLAELRSENERLKQEIEDLKIEISNQDWHIGELNSLIPY